MRMALPITTEENPYPETVVDYGDNPVYNAAITARNWISSQMFPTAEGRASQFENAALDLVGPMGGAAKIMSNNRLTDMMKQHFPNMYKYLDKTPIPIRIEEGPVAAQQGPGVMGVTIPLRSHPEKTLEKIDIFLDPEELAKYPGKHRTELTLAHEGGHAVDMVNAVENERQNIMLQRSAVDPVNYPGLYDNMLKERASTHKPESKIISSLYSKDRPHGIVELRAAKQLEAAGLDYNRMNELDLVRPDIKKTSISERVRTYDPDKEMETEAKKRIATALSKAGRLSPGMNTILKNPRSYTWNEFKDTLSDENKWILGHTLIDYPSANMKIRAGKGRFPDLINWINE